jgi:hypothetical protein
MSKPGDSQLASSTTVLSSASMSHRCTREQYLEHVARNMVIRKHDRVENRYFADNAER